MCTLQNAATNGECKACGAPRATSAAEPTGWVCSACTLANDARATRCSACGHSQAKTKRLAPAPAFDDGDDDDFA